MADMHSPLLYQIKTRVWLTELSLTLGKHATQMILRGDGVRCDMAMLILPEVFARTWGIAAQPFWSMATQQV